MLRKIVLAAVAAVLLPSANLQAQSFRQGGTEFHAKRPVTVPADKSYSIVVTEFYHHGEIQADGGNVLVAARARQLAPMRVLQLGPGDFCRLVFQTVRGQTSYEVFYGGDPPQESPPPLTVRDGLLLETRRYKNCNLNDLDSVRKAFDSSTPYGSDYVENVHHSRNPFSLKLEPFLSRYSGYLHTSAGTYGFLTSSRDCSFLLIDGKPVVSAPGRHGPTYQAKPGSRKDIQLSAGSHEFEYYHAAAGPDAIMVAAWEVSPAEEKPKPTAIPTEAFRTQLVGRLPAGPVTLASGKPVPDFALTIAGDVPLPDNPAALIGVSFRDASPKTLTMKAKVQWDFGDGQTSDRLTVDHVYLRPGLYTVRLRVARTGRTIEIAHRIEIDRPPLTRKDKDKLHKLDEYLPILRTYDPRTLDAASLRQLVAAYVAKAEALEAPADEEGETEDEARATAPSRPPAGARNTAEDAKAYRTEAVMAGKAALVEESAATGAEDLFKLAEIVGPMARDRLGDSELALQIWKGAAKKISVEVLRAQCAVEVADILVNDLPGFPAVRAPEAKRLLDFASAQLASKKTDPRASKLRRVWGDYYAATGDGRAARDAYRQAEQLLGVGRRYIERTAWRGAHARSTEEFIKQGRFDRAAERIQLWQDEFPAEKADGYLTLMYARYWQGLGKYDQAVAQAEQLQAVNAECPYIDQMLLLAADCDVKRGRTDRALATLQSLVSDYPGSPHLDEARKFIERLKSGDTEQPKRQPKE